jgi:hypothetical protein
MFDTNDTDWAISKKGNQWRLLHSRVLVVGQTSRGVWARVGDTFVSGLVPFTDIDEAMWAAECSAGFERQMEVSE